MVSSPKYERDVTHHCGGPTIKPLMIEGEMSIGIWVRIAMDTDTGVLAPFALPLLLKELNVLVLRDISRECFRVNPRFLVPGVSHGNDGD
jgi:hypothetical protein